MSIPADTITEDALASLELNHFRVLFPKWANYDASLAAIERRFDPENAKDGHARKKLKRLVEKARRMKTFADNADALMNSGLSEEIVTADGRVFNMRFQRKADSKDGQLLIGKSEMLIKIGADKAKAADNAQMLIYGFEFVSEAQKSRIGQSLPQHHTMMVLDGDTRAIGCDRRERVRLGDFLPEIADSDRSGLLWIVTSLLELAVFLEENKIVHGGINADSVWVDPVKQIATLNGGWWKAKSIKGNSDADLTDQLAIRQLGVRILNGSPVHEAVGSYLNALPMTDATGSLAQWLTALKKAKMRRLPKHDVDFENFYAEK